MCFGNFLCVHPLQPGTVAHEAGHALGFKHIQSRGDRDKTIKINWNVIRKGKEKNFQKLDTFNPVPYDLQSEMHYGPNVSISLLKSG